MTTGCVMKLRLAVVQPLTTYPDELTSKPEVFGARHAVAPGKFSIHSSELNTTRERQMLELTTIRMEIPPEANIIIGQAHFIKTVEDVYEAIVTTVPQAKFGLAFNESSGACLVRSEANDDVLREKAIRNAQALAAGHVFVLLIQNAYPINLLNSIRNIPEVCSIFCATANAVEVVVAVSDQGRGVLGVIDGSSPKGVEKESDIAWRHDLLRTIGYKR
jgi:adenosine/AMP kinase